jgi:hypothetical protein
MARPALALPDAVSDARCAGRAANLILRAIPRLVKGAVIERYNSDIRMVGRATICGMKRFPTAAGGWWTPRRSTACQVSVALATSLGITRPVHHQQDLGHRPVAGDDSRRVAVASIHGAAVARQIDVMQCHLR